MCAVLGPSFNYSNDMGYELRDKDFKQYPHFDAPISRDDLQKLVDDPQQVSSHPFLPFLVITKARNSFKSRAAGNPKKTPRPIRYAPRRDAAIFAAYRDKLSHLYERELSELGISECVIAYRKIRKTTDKKGGKCNIDFAKDAFDVITHHEDCTVFAFDISSYFENIDHEILKSQWCKLLAVDTLPEDHFSVFKAITTYAFAKKEDVYQRLGYLHPKAVARELQATYTKSKREMPKQLCSPEEFREKIAGKGTGYSNLIERNKVRGIPQGSPMSDVLANFYLLDFDVAMFSYATERNGTYFRYSDDILLIIPEEKVNADAVSTFIGSTLKLSGNSLKLSEQKTSIFSYSRRGDHHVCRDSTGTISTEGIEYLGFRFDGKSVYLRNATLSNLHRKISKNCVASAKNHIARHTGKDLTWLENNFDFKIIERAFGRAPNFEPYSNKNSWTFWTYAKKASICFEASGEPITRQLRKQKRFIRKQFLKKLRKIHHASP